MSVGVHCGDGTARIAVVGNAPGGRDRGSADALGIALIAAAALAMALVILGLGRRVDARATAANAAEAAAQAAAGERSASAAVDRARRVATTMLDRGESCRSPQIRVDVSEFVPGGRVAVTVTCVATGAGLELAGVADQRATATAFATIDPLRAVETTR